MNTLERDTHNGKIIRINSTIPDFIEIKNGIHGYLGMYSKIFFKEGEILYTRNAFPYNLDELNEEFELKTNIGDFKLFRDVHADDRFVYGFDSFTNHSCNDNLFCKFYEKDDETFCDTIAKRDIQIGEELIFNYNKIYYDLKDRAFKCNCGSENCYGEISGYKYISQENQDKILQEVDESTRNFLLKLKSEDK
jgi:hypothetical protein